MAQLIQIRQRIKAIETIKKITHAMRLISMSNRSRLKNKEDALKLYTDTLKALFFTIKTHHDSSWDNKILYPAASAPSKPLIILIGSQKGLCGNFNTKIFRLFETYLQQHNPEHNHYIVIGKKAVDYMSEHTYQFPGIVVSTYNEFSIKTLFSIAKALSHEILLFDKGYTQVSFISNKQKTLFNQKPYLFKLIPFSPSETLAHNPTQDYIWEQPPTELLDLLSKQYIEAAIQGFLFQSLLAEQGARFLSMDTATRNAQKLLEETTLLYNKLRQAKITKELTELAGSI